MDHPVDGDFFDSVSVINLTKRPERLAAFETRLRNANWKFQWPMVFRAVDGTALPRIPGYDRNSTWGCTQSHLRVIEEAIIAGHKRICVFEDDADFVPGFADKLDDFLARVPEWEVLLLGANNISGEKEYEPGIAQALYSSGTQCYALQGKGIENYYLALAQAHRVNTRGWPDVAFWSYDFQRNNRVYLPFPTLVGQAPGFSDITQCDRLSVF